MKTLFVTLALLLSLASATAHPNHTCHAHNVTTHCK